MRIALWFGWILTVVGVAILAGFGLYMFFRDIIGSQDVPVIVQVAIPALIAGVVILFLVTLINRLRARSGDRYKEVKY